MTALKMKLAVPVILVACLASLGQATAERSDDTMYLFVQSAERVSVDDDTITMKGVSPTTIYFSDRPERIAGHMLTKHFTGSWAEGDDSFALNNPNAALSVFTPDGVETITVVLSNPILKGDKLSYTIRVLDGDMPAKGGECSLFIDVIGRPRSPMSIGGVARRTTMRHVVRRRTVVEADAEADAEVAHDKAVAAEATAKATEGKTTEHTPEQKMEQLNKIYKDGYITEDEYKKKKEAILSTF